MNILQLCKFYPPALGGIELVEKTITKAHVELKDKVVIAAFSTKEPSSKGIFGEDIYHVKQDFLFKSAPISFTFIFKFQKLIVKYGIERIYVHLPNPYMHEVLKFSGDFLKKRNVEVVAVYHSDIVNQKKLGSLYNVYFSLTNKFYDAWICSSRKLWESSDVLSKVDNKKQVIIPFCTEGDLIYRAREKFQGNLLAVGRLVPYKGFDFLIKAINKTKFKLYIIGDGPEYKSLQKIAGNNIFLLRNVTDEEKRSLYDKCDLLIVSSLNRAEAYGMIIVESFEAGLPVVSSNINSGVTYLVQHEKTGLLYDVEDENGLFNCIERFEKDHSLYKSTSVNTRKFYENELSYEHFKDRISKIQVHIKKG